MTKAPGRERGSVVHAVSCTTRDLRFLFVDANGDKLIEENDLYGFMQVRQGLKGIRYSY